jgi:hypothetical protein
MHRITPGIILLAAAAVPAQASTYNAVSMTAASGTFTAYDTISGTPAPPSNWTNTQNPGANLVGGYVDLGAVAMFFGVPMYLYTGDGINSPYGAASMPPWGGPVPTAVLDDVAHTIHADLSALTWFWNFNNFSQGTVQATGTWDPSTGVYHLAWNTPFTPGYNFDGLVGQWTMTGVAAIPEPEAYAQMLAALALMVPMLRRRRFF